MPELDFDMITLGHGSGGRLTNDLLDKSIFSLFKSEELQQRHDGAFLNLSGKIAFTTDSYVVHPIFFPGGNIGELAINGTINDLAMCGAVPRYISLALIIEEGMLIEDLWEILVSMKVASENMNVRIVTGDTKVVEKGKGDKIFINTTGIGTVLDNVDFRIERIKTDDAIVVSGPMASHGMAIMSVREGLTFESDISSDTRPLNQMTETLLRKYGKDIKLLRDPTRGGVATVLNEIAAKRGFGIELNERTFPIDKQVQAACEMLGMDPLYVANEGIFLAVVSNSVAESVISTLKMFDSGRQAEIIGYIRDSHPGKVYVKSLIGGHRVVSMLTGEQLPRIC